MSAPESFPAPLTPEELRRKAAAKWLKDAAKLAALHAAKRPLLSFRMGRGKAAADVLLTWPYVLTVYDPATGDKLAESEPGKPDTLKARP